MSRVSELIRQHPEKYQFDGDPIVEAVLISSTASDGKPAFQWKVFCPHCYEYHFHGAGEDVSTVRKHLGHRLSHCQEGHGYTLIWTGKEDKRNKSA